LAFLDDDGYLRTPLETIADRAPLGLVASEPQRKPMVEELLRALTALQLFLDPPGVAARDARECLLLQLDAMEGDDDAEPMSEAQYEILSAARRIVDQHLDDLMQNRLPRIGEKTGLSMERIKEGLVLLRRLQRELGMAIVFVTHDLGVAGEIADRVAVMYGGRFVEQGTAAEVLRGPAHPYTRGLLGATVAAGVPGQPLTAIPGAPPNLRSLPAGCAFAPRCAEAEPACHTAPPPARALGPGRMALCVKEPALA
jgi:oligopeptide/dipeptide ABC transporter ATP-binding protein